MFKTKCTVSNIKQYVFCKNNKAILDQTLNNKKYKEAANVSVCLQGSVSDQVLCPTLLVTTCLKLMLRPGIFTMTSTGPNRMELSPSQLTLTGLNPEILISRRTMMLQYAPFRYTSSSYILKQYVIVVISSVFCVSFCAVLHWLVCPSCI